MLSREPHQRQPGSFQGPSPKARRDQRIRFVDDYNVESEVHAPTAPSSPDLPYPLENYMPTPGTSSMDLINTIEPLKALNVSRDIGPPSYTKVMGNQSYYNNP